MFENNEFWLETNTQIFKNNLRPVLNECRSIATLYALNIDAMTMYHVRMLVWSVYHLDEKSLKSCPLTYYLSHRPMATNMTRTLFHVATVILQRTNGTNKFSYLHKMKQEITKVSIQTCSRQVHGTWINCGEHESESVKNWANNRCEFNILPVDLLYDPETNIELFRSAVETAVTRPGELVVNG